LILPVTRLAPMASASIAVVECESNLESDLVMRNLAAFYVAARLHHFEPANLSQRARCTPDGGLDSFLDALFRRARDLDDPVNMVRHRPSSVGQWPVLGAGTFAGFIALVSLTLNFDDAIAHSMLALASFP
jgi:hypothetical protein